MSASLRPAEAIKVSIETNGPAARNSPSAMTVQREHDPQLAARRPDNRNHVLLAR